MNRWLVVAVLLSFMACSKQTTPPPVSPFILSLDSPGDTVTTWFLDSNCREVIVPGYISRRVGSFISIGPAQMLYCFDTLPVPRWGIIRRPVASTIDTIAVLDAAHDPGDLAPKQHYCPILGNYYAWDYTRYGLELCDPTGAPCDSLRVIIKGLKIDTILRCPLPRLPVDTSGVIVLIYHGDTARINSSWIDSFDDWHQWPKAATP